MFYPARRMRLSETPRTCEIPRSNRIARQVLAASPITETFYRCDCRLYFKTWKEDQSIGGSRVEFDATRPYVRSAVTTDRDIDNPVHYRDGGTRETVESCSQLKLNS